MNGGTISRSGGMSVSLSGPDGRVIGGGLAGLLLAAGPVQVRFQPVRIEAFFPSLQCTLSIQIDATFPILLIMPKMTKHKLTSKGNEFKVIYLDIFHRAPC